MSNKPKLEKDYNDYNKTIERKAQEEIKKIRDKIVMVKEEAERIGETLESEIDKDPSEE
jgi:hypothetical protein